MLVRGMSGWSGGIYSLRRAGQASIFSLGLYRSSGSTTRHGARAAQAISIISTSHSSRLARRFCNPDLVAVVWIGDPQVTRMGRMGHNNHQSDQKDGLNRVKREP